VSVKIPSEKENEGRDRKVFVEDVVKQCLHTREDRIATYRNLKQYYLYGREQSADPADNIFGTVNKIWSHLDQVVSFLYAQDTTRFSIELSRSVPEEELLKVPALNEAINDHWHSSNTDIRYGDSLLWSLVYGSMFIKPRWNHDHIVADILEPHNVGVWREDYCGLDNQDAVVHCYKIPQPQLRRALVTAQYKNVDEILEQAIPTAVENESSVGPMERVVTTSTAMPAVTGQINTPIGPRMTYAPKIAVPMVQMYEAYIYDDDIGDYRVFTVAKPFLPIYDREMERMFLPKQMPLIQVCPFPIHDFFFGMSLVERLISLQMMRNVRWDQIQHMLEMQASPSSFGVGQFGSADEIQDALDTPGGLVLGQTGDEMARLEVKVPEDIFAEVNFIDAQFNEVDGTTPIMSGKGEEGVRSEGHASQLLRVGASRAKRRALIVEDSLEELATLYLRILQKYSDAKYRADPQGEAKEGLIFVAKQFTEEFMVKVDAHSNSPLFMQDLVQLAFELFKAHAIDRETLIDMLPVQMKDLLKMRLKTKIEPAEARAAAAQEKLARETGKVSELRGKK
jgi:hypothetical protein